MPNMAYLAGMLEKSGFDANIGDTFRMGVLLKNFIIKFNSGEEGVECGRRNAEGGKKEGGRVGKS
jgi:hypothetical protein